MLTSSLAGGYLWSNGSTARSITVGAAGIYSVRVYNGSNCYSTSLPLTVRVVPARLKSDDVTISTPADFRVYPNPASDFLEASVPSHKNCKGLIRMMDIRGTIVMSEPIEMLPGENKFTFDISSLHSGVYYTQLISDDNNTIIEVVVQQ